jgi:branched-chain amino acid transport system substrate-binding protein
MRLSSVAASACLGAASLLVVACGGDDGGSAASGGKTLNVYVSLPFQGASKSRSEDMLLGAKIALKQAGNTAGGFKINLVSEDNSVAQSGKWDPAATSTIARKAAQDEAAIAYLGELNSGAAAVSIPILNEAGILQVSAANTAVGLTRAEGAEPGEPDKYYPSGKRNYGRVVPADHLQAAASVAYMQEHGCTSVYLTHDNEVYGKGLATQVQKAAASKDIAVTGFDGIEVTAANFRSLAAAIVKSGATCFYYGGITANNAVQLYKDVNAAAPDMKLFGPDGVSDADFSENLTPALEERVYVTTPTLPPNQYPPAGQALFEELRKAKGGSSPDAYALYTYEAMNAILLAIETAGEQGDDRAAVVDSFFTIKDRQSVLGTYSIDQFGDTTLKSYGGNRVKDGVIVFDKIIEV